MSSSLTQLLTEESIRERIAEMGQDIARDYQGKDLLVVAVLDGAFIFTADLIRQIDQPLSCTFLKAHSYHGQESTGIVEILEDVKESLQDRDVLLVEDIVDTGKTLEVILENFQSRHPRSLRVCSLLCKKDKNHYQGKIDYLGFEIPDVFVVGYGMDLDGQYRSLPAIYSLQQN